MEAQMSYRRRYLRWWWEEEEDRTLRLTARLSDEDGTRFVKAIERMVDTLPPDPVSGLFDSFEEQSADALAGLAGANLSAEADQDRATVVVHVDAHILSGEDGVGELDEGPAIHPETARRLSCDARIQVALHSQGKPLGVGRAQRTVPPWLSRQLRRRDGGCRFPGCGRTRWLHAHHLHHWANGGRTDSDNLVLLCSAHHRAVHEGGFRIRGRPEGRLEVIRPDGEPVPHSPEPLRCDIRYRFFGQIEQPR
jgi:hypothetical protein